MISAVTPSPRPSAARPASPERAAQPVDLSVIDTPQEAALLPALSAASMVLLLQGVGDALEARAGLSSVIEGTVGGTPVRFDYQMPDPASGHMRQEGRLGEAPFDETWQVDGDKGTISITGGVAGTSAESLVVQASDEATTIEGSIGGMPVHQQMTAEADGWNARFVWNGTVGDQSLHQELSWKTNPDHTMTFHAIGALGDAPIDVTSTVTQQGDGMKMSGKGTVAGIEIDYTQSLGFLAPTVTSSTCRTTFSRADR